MRFFNPFTVWTGVPLAQRTVTVTTNSDKTGYTASTVSDKTGYALTAGSYTPIKTIQRGTITLTGAASNTATISAVTTAKTTLVNLGITTSVSMDSDSACVQIVLTNTTTITASRTGTSGNVTVSYEAVEYF